MRKARFLCFLKVSVCHLYLINFSLEREIIIFVLENVWKKSGILDPKLCETCTFKSRQKSLQTEKVPNGQKKPLKIHLNELPKIVNVHPLSLGSSYTCDVISLPLDITV